MLHKEYTVNHVVSDRLTVYLIISNNFYYIASTINSHACFLQDFCIKLKLGMLLHLHMGTEVFTNNY